MARMLVQAIEKSRPQRKESHEASSILMLGILGSLTLRAVPAKAETFLRSNRQCHPKELAIAREDRADFLSEVRLCFLP